MSEAYPPTAFEPLPIDVKIGSHVQMAGHDYVVDRLRDDGTYRIRRRLSSLFVELIEVEPPVHRGNFIERRMTHLMWKHEEEATDGHD